MRKMIVEIWGIDVIVNNMLEFLFIIMFLVSAAISVIAVYSSIQHYKYRRALISVIKGVDATQDTIARATERQIKMRAELDGTEKFLNKIVREVKKSKTSILDILDLWKNEEDRKRIVKLADERGKK